MKYLLLLCLGLISVGSYAQNDTIIWRTVSILNERSLTIGEPIELLNDIVVMDAPNVYHLKNGEFTGAQSIVLETDKKGRLAKITFHYDPDSVSFDNSVNTLNKSLVGAQYTLKRKKRESFAMWCDNYSCFRLNYEQDKSGTIQFYSEIAAL